jgi:hypothetical protein
MCGLRCSKISVFNFALVKNVPLIKLKTGWLGLNDNDLSLEMAAIGQQPKCGNGKSEMYSPFFVLVFGDFVMN